MSRVGWLFLAVIVLIIAGGIMAFPRFEGAAPEITGPGELLVGAEGAALAFEVADSGTGLRSV